MSDFDNNPDLQKKLTQLITEKIREINTEPGLTQAQKAEVIKQLGGAPKKVLFE